MKTFTAKQYSNTMQPWQADKAAKQAKKQAKQFKQNRSAKRSVWECIG
ncbi:hypothetical protein Barba22A_gp052 [Rheinheimera phage vB_RspM_Barba22A]|jgi:hypothetical protein|uniref:Uncharacterized protein n=83 Tax=Barbavirus TaxID=2733095 RepID=A0A7G9VRS6_9CAUD|nr:hypothetical protein HOV44_gp056 [Rheinheimera phage Barba5S]YP_009822790.1 hypothetical protein HOV45_gp054 [Rheinheimera phage Barba8S]YP_009822929.1 hypothetical protein HOV46_gp052 [Rheinheimera phage vB_RspM_Barba18A]YP_009823208.1 hypothetical protein HOV48_gp052 [Rheinheimera phage Barba21A]QCQ57903.1 hypothetical protein Barba1A_gp052 [Rheinheimera phage vB_RspM_Barba1A]QCQ58039.1 hypothetical protein Barba1S_gp052 [Rheinheimera phage vB_RspM_Barba1S]QCQ58175.1 hypothetical protein